MLPFMYVTTQSMNRLSIALLLNKDVRVQKTLLPKTSLDKKKVCTEPANLEKWKDLN